MGGAAGDGLDFFFQEDLADIGVGLSASDASAPVAHQDAVEMESCSEASTTVGSPAEPETPEELTGMSPVAEPDVEMLSVAVAPAPGASTVIPLPAIDLSNPRAYKGQKGVAFDLD